MQGGFLPKSELPVIDLFKIKFPDPIIQCKFFFWKTTFGNGSLKSQFSFFHIRTKYRKSMSFSCLYGETLVVFAIIQSESWTERETALMTLWLYSRTKFHELSTGSMSGLIRAIHQQTNVLIFFCLGLIFRKFQIFSSWKLKEFV